MAGFVCTNICQVLIFPILDILFIKTYPEMGRGYYRGPPRGFEEQWNKGNFFQGNRGTKA